MSIFDQFPTPPCATTLGWKLIDADANSGTVQVEFEGSTAFCNPSGNIQGGFIAAMLDDTLGPTVLVKTGGTHYCATIDLNIGFLAPARPGRFVGIGRITQIGKTIAFLEGELRDASNIVVARATASARVVPTADLQRK
jgi:uncharacterized protein (TIGR00369 family)